MAMPATDDEGRCRIEGLRKEESQLRVLHVFSEEQPWMAPPGLTVVPDGQTVVVRMRRARLLKGRATCATAPVPFVVMVHLERADGTVVSAGGSGREGEFQVRVPLDEVGPLVLVGSGRIADGRTLTGRMDVPPPEAGDVTLELREP
jgi:hypothetical protein